MATIRKRGTKWQVQIPRVGVRPISRSFSAKPLRKDAEAWARQMEVQADRRDLPSDPKSLQRVTLGQLVERYRDTVSVRKRGYDVERIAPPGARRDNQKAACKAACKNFENLLELPSE
jgi:hypothetical protein